MRWLGNSGAPRWYNCDSELFHVYLDHIMDAGASGAEIVLHDGEADEYTARVHVLRSDWEQVIRDYRDRELSLSVHGPLTPEFSPKRWRDDPGGTIDRYQPVLQQVAELAQEQGSTTLILHALADPQLDLDHNEQGTSEFLSSILDRVTRWSEKVTIALELRAYREERASAAATTRESVAQVVRRVGDDRVGICWDIAHDLESRLALGQDWEDPDDDFLEMVRHIHLHDLGPEDEPHYPPVVGRVPQEPLHRLSDRIPVVMEVRWRMAQRRGDPWDVLRQSYDHVSARSRS
jgi:sugar phosphate isomerase/epimerase